MAEPKRVTKLVTVIRTFESDDDKSNRSYIFSSAVINKKLVRMNIVPGAEVDLPIEIIAQLKGRGVPKEVNRKLVIRPEFVITEV